MLGSVSELLDQVQSVMEESGLWQSIPPTPDKMMSTEPFSIDTLSFIEWLQWIYIARLRAIVEAGTALPVGAKVLEYAEEALKADGMDNPALLFLIKKLDSLMK